MYLLLDCYIGSSIDIPKRLAGHQAALRAGRHHCHHLQRWWTKHKRRNITHSILQPLPDGSTKEQVQACEQIWLDRYRARGIPLMNHALLATGGHGPVSAETRRKMSIAMTGRVRGPHRPAHRRKIARTLKRAFRGRSAEMAERSRTGWTPERKTAQTKKLHRQWADDGYRRAMVTERRGRGDRFRRRVASASKRTWKRKTREQRAAFRATMSAAAKRRYADPVERKRARRRSRALAADPAWRSAIQAGAQRRSARPSWRKRNAEARRRDWQDPLVRERRLAGIRAGQRRRRQRERAEREADSASAQQHDTAEPAGGPDSALVRKVLRETAEFADIQFRR